MTVAEEHDALLQAKGTCSPGSPLVAPLLLVALIAYAGVEVRAGILIVAPATPNTSDGTVAITTAPVPSGDVATKFRNLMNVWTSDASRYDSDVWPEIVAALEANRSSKRSLF